MTNFGPMPALRESHGTAPKLFGRQSVTVLREHAAPEELPLPPSYRHVGVIQQLDGSIKDEVRQRSSEAWYLFRQGRKKLFRNRQVGLGTRLTLWRTMVLSKLFYGAGSWPSLDSGACRLIQATILNMARQVAIPPRSAEQRLHQCEVCAAAEIACPAVLMFAERLRYLRLLVANGPAVLWALIKQDPDSLSPIQTALNWLHAREPTANSLGPPACSWQLWEGFIRDQPARASVKRALRLDVARQRCLAALSGLHRQLSDLQGPRLVRDCETDLADLEEALSVAWLSSHTLLGPTMPQDCTNTASTVHSLPPAGLAYLAGALLPRPAASEGT